MVPFGCPCPAAQPAILLYHFVHQAWDAYLAVTCMAC